MEKDKAQTVFSLIHTSIITSLTGYYFYTGSLALSDFTKVYSVGYLITDASYFYIYKNQIIHYYIYL